MVAFKQIFLLKNKNKNKNTNKNLASIFWFFSCIWISSKSYFFSTSNFFSNYFNKSINILSMFSFLLNSFINLYLDLVVSYIRDLNPQYNFSITASWWGSMLANSFKFKSAQGFIHKPSGINNSEISRQCFLTEALWSVVMFCFSWPTVNQREDQ